MERLGDLEAFLAVVEKGSLTAAARHLGRSLQSISRSLATLEAGMGVELIRRTTRQSAPTDIGLAFYQRVKPAFGEIQEAKLEASNRRAEPAGLLRIGGPVFFSPAYLVPIIAAFMDRYPRIEVDLKLSDRFVDLGVENLDLVVRIGELPDSELKARRFGDLRRVFFGAPAYFRQHGRPEHPDDLARHQCIVRATDGTAAAWPFRLDGKSGSVNVSGRFRADGTAAVYSAVALGLGIGFTPLWQIRHLVDQGTVELILVDYEPPRIPIHAVWHGSKAPLAKARLFIEFLVSGLALERL
ncbi:MAG TPA: LysR family transcriptional regulator [Alphaproteobacteria bacterium]|nr:LysR family transcriptional regulator [Alphaproteobacteria bacterium]